MKKTIIFTITSLGMISTGAFAANSNSDSHKYDKKSDQTTQRMTSTSANSNQQDWGSQKSMNSTSQIQKVDEQRQKSSLQSSDLVGAEVTDGRQHKVGSISDLEVDTSGKVVAAYLDVGGLLGINATTFRVPYEDLQVSEQQDGMQVTLQQSTLDQLASMSDDLREDMQDWQNSSSDRMAQTGNSLEGDMQRAGDSVQRSMSQAGQSMREAGRNISAEARQMKNDIKSQFSDNKEVAQQLDGVNIDVQQNRITLDGTVRSEDTKDEIVSAIEEHSNGREVVDNIQVNEDMQVSVNY